MIASDPTSPIPHWRGWLPLIIAGVAYAVLIAVVVGLRTHGVGPEDEYQAARARTTSDFRDFWWTANQFRQTGRITSETGVHNYLPFFTIFMLPWSFLPLQLAAILFSLLSLGLFAATIVLVESLLRDGLPRRPQRPLLIAIALALPYVHACLVLGNVSLLVLFLVVAAWFFVERGREWEAGGALGLAALIKLLPALLIVFFLIKRRWRVAGTAAGTMVILGLLVPLFSLGYTETVAQHAGFYQRALADHSAIQTLTADKPPKMNYGNNALPAVLRRLLSPINAGKNDTTGRLYVNVADLPRGAILAIYIIIMGLILAASLVATLRGPRRWPPESVPEGRSLRAQFGVWCCLMLLASPLMWTHYLPLAYWPLALMADRGERTWRAHHRPDALAAVALLIWLAGCIALASPTARAAGAQLASVLVLWLMLAILTIRRP
jgi:hypothetical protein